METPTREQQLRWVEHLFSELEPLLELKQEPESARRLGEMMARLEKAP